MPHDSFELHRLSDSLVYQLDRRSLPDGSIGYQRRDADLWITFRPELGWAAYDEETHSIMGRPWHVQPKDQAADYPPAGEWVTKKGAKSYVYELKYLPPH